MTKHEKADQARKGLIDSVTGKAKELVGAVTGNDSLTAEGQLEQTQAQQRKEANAMEAVGDAEAAQAQAEARQATAEGAAERLAVDAQTAGVENAVRTQQAAHKRAAEQTGQRAAAKEKIQAELDAQRDIERANVQERGEVGAAAEDVAAAVAEHQSSVRAATSAQAEADRIRRRADNLTDEADLP